MLSELAEAVKSCTCDVLQDRLTLGALITLDVHARDVVQQLVDAKVAHTTDFEWASQLRYYWRENVWVEMVQACIAYGYEYLGNTPRHAATCSSLSQLSHRWCNPRVMLRKRLKVAIARVSLIVRPAELLQNCSLLQTAVAPLVVNALL